MAEHIADRDFRIFFCNYFEQDAFYRRVELVIHLVGLQFDEWVSRVNFLALALEPLDDDYFRRWDSSRFRNSERGDDGDPPVAQAEACAT